MQDHFQLLDVIVLVVYLCSMLVVGYICGKRNTTSAHFFVGNRSIPAWAVGISIFATQLSAITFISIPGTAFHTDMSWMIVNLGIPVVGLVVALKFLPVYCRRSYTSLYEILEERFGVETRVYGALAYVLMQIGRCAVVLYLPALALSEVTGLPVSWMIFGMGVLVTLYTVWGGIEVVIWTDVVQAIILFGGACLALLIMGWQTDGGFETLNAVASENHKFNMVHTDFSESKDFIGYMLLGAFFANFVPYISDQTVVQRYFTTRNIAEARRCVYTGVLFAIPATLLFFYIGSMLFAFYEVHPDLWTLQLKEGEYDRVFPFFIVQQLPAGISGLLLAAIFAGSMSSLDSSLNSVATVCVQDFYQRFHHPDCSDAQRLRLARWITVIMGTFATLAALGVAVSLSSGDSYKLSLDLFMAISGLVGGTLAGVFTAAVLTKRVNQTGIVVGIVTGTAVLALVRFNLQWHTMTFAATGVITTFMVSYLVSLIAPQSSKLQ